MFASTIPVKIDVAHLSLDVLDAEGWRPLHYAAWENHSEIVAMLLENGANIDLGNSFGSTALHLAGGLGHVDSLRALLLHRTPLSLTIKNQDRHTPRVLALRICENNKDEVLALLDD